MFLRMIKTGTNKLKEITVQIRTDKIISTQQKTNYHLLKYLVMLSH